MSKQKYVRLKEYNEIIIFPCIIEHSKFRFFNPITAGFCYVTRDRVSCFGHSISLRLESDEESDSALATKQLFKKY
jgi:hypothetical protein